MFRPAHFPGSLLICSALFAPQSARADAAKPFEREQTAMVRPITQREFADAATTQIEFLKELRAWRNTLRGSGVRREFGFSPLRDQKLAISLGQVAPPEMGGGAGVTARWNRFGIGTTAQPEALDGVLNHFDSLLTGSDVKPQNPTQLNWLRARLSESKGAQIEVMAARAARDGDSKPGDSKPGDSKPGDSKPGWRGADFQSARVRFQLPAKWSLSGDFSRAAVEREAENDAASAWGVAAAGPISHPFGVARASARWNDVGAGYVAPTAQSGALGGQNGTLELGQDLKIGPLSGQLNFGAATRRRADSDTARVGDELAQQSARGAAQVALALTPNLSVTSSGNWNSAAATRASNDLKADDADRDETTPGSAISTRERDTHERDTHERELSRQLSGDFGLQWNFSRSLSLAATLGASSQNSHLESATLALFSPQSDEMRRALEIRQKSGANDFRLRFSQRTRQNGALGSETNQNAPVSQWRLEAARPLLMGMRLKTILDFASDDGKNQSARRFEAQFQLARAARLDARYREGDLAPGLLSDEWSSAFAAFQGAPKQVSARFGVGSAATGAGLGMSLELVRSQGALPDSYRVGVQFK